MISRIALTGYSQRDTVYMPSTVALLLMCRRTKLYASSACKPIWVEMLFWSINSSVPIPLKRAHSILALGKNDLRNELSEKSMSALVGYSLSCSNFINSSFLKTCRFISSSVFSLYSSLKPSMIKLLAGLSIIISLSKDIFLRLRSNDAMIDSSANLLVEPTRIYVPFNFPFSFR